MSYQKNILFRIQSVFIYLIFLNLVSCSSSKTKQVVNNSQDYKLLPATSLLKKSVTDSIDKLFSNKQNMVDVYVKPIKDSITVITLNIVGDLMCHMPQANNAKTALGYDFDPSFAFIKDYLADADATIGNLELTTAGTRTPYSGYPAFNAPDEYITSLKNNGFDFLVTSNNHSMDTGEEGLLRTIEQVNKNNLGYTGTFNSQKDHDSIRILDIKGIKIAVLNYTYGTNGAYPAANHKYMLNIIDSLEISNEIKRAILLKPDFVLVFYHYGIEYAAEPIESQRKIVEWARKAGAKIIIGCHPHVVGPCKLLSPDSDHPDTTFVAWSMGNFFSNQNKRYCDAGVILTLHLQKNNRTKTVNFSTIEFLPTWVYRGQSLEKKQHVIFPAEYSSYQEKIPSFLDASLVNKMKEAFNDTKLIINKYGSNASLKKLKLQ